MKHKIFFLIASIALTFTTCKKDEPAPIASLEIADANFEVSYREAVVKWRISSNATVNEAVLEYAIDSIFTDFKQEKMSKVNPKTDDNLYSCVLKPLMEGTQYYIRCRAINKINSYASAHQSFTTKGYHMPIVRTDSVSSITVSSAQLHATLLDRGTDTVPEVGFCIAKHADVTIADSCIVSPLKKKKDSVIYSLTLNNLEDNVKYYARAYAKNCIGVTYGEELFFTTAEILVPEVGPVTVSDISYTTATVSSEVLSDGGTSVIERGVCYSIYKNPTISNSKVLSGDGLGSFVCALTDLNDETTYHIRAYATNSKGTSYSKDITFTTSEYALPSVVTSAVTDISYTTAICGGNVTADGGQTVTERGICYSISSNPTISDNKIASGSKIGTFTCELTGLTAETTYYVRAYATNSLGTAYGDEVKFATTTYGLPTVTTSAATNISCTTATCGGNVTADGGQSVTERGICYSTSQNPTTSNTKITQGSGTGSFTCNMAGLTAGTKYYVRAYAINSKGTSYGNEVTFTTTAYGLPTVMTSATTNVSYTTATCVGNVTADGGQTVTERGICYSISSNPTISDNKIASGSGTGSFTCNLIGLIAGTTYYIRAYAINNQGTAYGATELFETLVLPQGAISGLFSVSSTRQVFISKGNLQYHALQKKWRFAEHQYEIIGEGNSNISSFYDGWIDLFGWGTSGWNSGAIAYQPWSTTTSDNSYYPGNSPGNSLQGSYAKADWGVYNPITNGGNLSGIWRTLTLPEWEYILNNRNNAENLRGGAIVNGIKGYVFLPDDWILPNDLSFVPNSPKSNSNIYTIDEWTKMENNGAVFLPISYYRRGTTCSVLASGGYWSATPGYGGAGGEEKAWFFFFNSNSQVLTSTTYRSEGHAVRLVQDVQ